MEATEIEDVAQPPEGSPLDVAPRTARRRRWRSAIRAAEIGDDIAAAFFDGAATAPEAIWRPSPRDCTTSQTRGMLEYWSDLIRTHAVPVPAPDRIDPLDFAFALGFVHLVEPSPAADDFLYRIFGTSVTGLSGDDFSGRRISELKASDYVVDFSIASCGAVCDRLEPLLTRRRPAHAATVEYWERLILPFAATGQALQRLLICTMPVSTNGAIVKSPPRF